MKKFLLILAIIASEAKQSHAQWTAKNAFEQKVFIENKGQYELKDKASKEEILFGARQDGLHYYFTKNSIYIKHNTLVKRSEKEIEAEMSRLGIKGEVEKELVNKLVEEFHQINFVGGGIGTEIEKYNEVTQLYNFSPNGKNISAHAYKRLIYKNLYPGVDMEFYFPEDKQGFKYNFILQVGADASLIKVQFPLADKVKLSNEGNIIISSLFGNFIEHAPEATIAEGTSIDCSFKLTKNCFDFNLGNYDKSKSLIIDPWTTTPVFAGSNSAYDVDWDVAGNCYAYGGIQPFQVIKYNSAGTQQWSYTTNFASSGGGSYYGDFAVDKKSRSVYITDGFNGSNGAQVLKLNQLGLQVAIYNGTPLFQEMWRISFYECSHQAVIAGGGTTNPSYTGCYLDTNLTSLIPVNIINSPTGLHDTWGIVIDPHGNTYFSTAKTQVGSPGYDNILYKAPLPTLQPVAWSSPTTYSFVEVGSVNYTPGPGNGFNGMTMSDTTLYTYDSYVLKKWSTANGVVLNSLNVNGGSQATMTYGGLTSDDCGNVFAGLNNTVKQYNSNLGPIATYTLAGMVYDLGMNHSSTLYACGNGFVSALAITTMPCSEIPCNSSTSVQAISENDFSIYPNPSAGNVNIEFTQAQEKTKITLYNAMGQKLQTQTTNQKLVTIPLQNLPEGVYMIEISTKDKTSVKKINKINP